VAFLGGVSAELAIVVFFLGVFFLKYGWEEGVIF
jgi:hypothetical protein